MDLPLEVHCTIEIVGAFAHSVGFSAEPESVNGPTTSSALAFQEQESSVFSKNLGPVCLSFSLRYYPLPISVAK